MLARAAMVSWAMANYSDKTPSSIQTQAKTNYRLCKKSTGKVFPYFRGNSPKSIIMRPYKMEDPVSCRQIQT